MMVMVEAKNQKEAAHLMGTSVGSFKSYGGYVISDESEDAKTCRTQPSGSVWLKNITESLTDKVSTHWFLHGRSQIPPEKLPKVSFKSFSIPLIKHKYPSIHRGTSKVPTLIETLRSVGCRKSGDYFILDEFSTEFYLKFDVSADSETPESKGTCDVIVMPVGSHPKDDVGIRIACSFREVEVLKLLSALRREI